MNDILTKQSTAQWYGIFVKRVMQESKYTRKDCQMHSQAGNPVEIFYIIILSNEYSKRQYE